MLYAHARIASIIRKSGKDPKALSKDGVKAELSSQTELALALKVAQFPDAVESMIEDLSPNRLCIYAHELSTHFSEFYAQNQVIGSEEEEGRLVLCEATAAALRGCFKVLGITPLYRI